MNNLTFTGRLAASPDLRKSSSGTTIAKFVLIRNEYAGTDEGGEKKERSVRVRFTAFGSRGEAINNNCRQGDQLIVKARIANNDYTDKDGNEVYGFEFLVEEFEFGAPGAAKREALAAAREGATR